MITVGLLGEVRAGPGSEAVVAAFEAPKDAQTNVFRL
jgi:hypothetical protein